MFSKLKIFIEVMRLWHTSRKNDGIRICPEPQAQQLVRFIEYRALLSLYELHTELKEDMSWNDFISFVQKSNAARKKIQRIIGWAISHFNVELLDFEIPVDALEYQEDYPDEPLIVSVKIFSDKRVKGIIELLFMQFEAEHFRRLAAVIPNYTWKAYMNDLSTDSSLWDKFTRGFQYGLRQLNFKASWIANSTQEEILRLEF